jgi:PhzF family phenazine biosynthesis protein
VSVRAPACQVLDAGDARLAQALACAAPARLGALEPALVAIGPRFWCVEFADEATVRGFRPDLAAIAELMVATSTVGCLVFARDRAGGLVVRVFCPADGIPEDPVTGAANAALAGLLHARGALGELGNAWRVSQGREVGRDGRIDVRVDDRGAVWIGGATQTVIRGTVDW